ncbi:MAG TPA: hypothetical protein VF680_17105 [Allosphingosinicella sp.]|jgi:uncharacterized protein with PIN domain
MSNKKVVDAVPSIQLSFSKTENPLFIKEVVKDLNRLYGRYGAKAILVNGVETTKEQPKHSRVYWVNSETRIPKCPKCNRTIEIPTDPDVRSIMTYHCDNCHYSE